MLLRSSKNSGLAVQGKIIEVIEVVADKVGFFRSSRRFLCHQRFSAFIFEFVSRCFLKYIWLSALKGNLNYDGDFEGTLNQLWALFNFPSTLSGNASIFLEYTLQEDIQSEDICTCRTIKSIKNANFVHSSVLRFRVIFSAPKSFKSVSKLSTKRESTLFNSSFMNSNPFLDTFENTSAAASTRDRFMLST